MKKELAFWCWD